MFVYGVKVLSIFLVGIAPLFAEPPINNNNPVIQASPDPKETNPISREGEEGRDPVSPTSWNEAREHELRDLYEGLIDHKSSFYSRLGWTAGGSAGAFLTYFIAQRLRVAATQELATKQLRYFDSLEPQVQERLRPARARLENALNRYEKAIGELKRKSPLYRAAFDQMGPQSCDRLLERLSDGWSVVANSQKLYTRAQRFLADRVPKRLRRSAESQKPMKLTSAEERSLDELQASANEAEDVVQTLRQELQTMRQEVAELTHGKAPEIPEETAELRTSWVVQSVDEKVADDAIPQTRRTVQIFGPRKAERYLYDLDQAILKEHERLEILSGVRGEQYRQSLINGLQNFGQGVKNVAGNIYAKGGVSLRDVGAGVVTATRATGGAVLTGLKAAGSVDNWGAAGTFLWNRKFHLASGLLAAGTLWTTVGYWQEDEETLQKFVGRAVQRQLDWEKDFFRDDLDNATLDHWIVSLQALWNSENRPDGAPWGKSTFPIPLSGDGRAVLSVLFKQAAESAASSGRSQWQELWLAIVASSEAENLVDSIEPSEVAVRAFREKIWEDPQKRSHIERMAADTPQSLSAMAMIRSRLFQAKKTAARNTTSMEKEFWLQLLVEEELRKDPKKIPKDDAGWVKLREDVEKSLDPTVFNRMIDASKPALHQN